MSFVTRTKHQSTTQDWAFYGVTVGTVVDTNDPQQMGRVRAQCLALNDPAEGTIDLIPWSSYAAPFAGTVQQGTRGDEEQEITGPVAYGMWAIPKVGSQVLVMCLDGNPQTRVWVGCLHTELATHTMPHGRFSYQDTDGLPSDSEKPVGPFSTFEENIEPLHTNIREAFGTAESGQQNFEFQSRGADFQLSGVTLGQSAATVSEVEDDADEATGQDGTLTESRQGYQTSRIAPEQPGIRTPRNLDNMVTALVSPGFHALSMDDRAENSRIRVRSTNGHQIIMDDTNERIYISTSTGKNWIEMDEQGNIDIYTSGKISAHADHDINFTSERSFRVYAKSGIHLKSDTEVRIQGGEDISLKTDGALRAISNDNILLQTGQNLHQKVAGDFFVESQGEVNVKTSTLKLEGTSVAHIKSGGAVNVLAGANANIQGRQVQLNGSTSADSASEALEADPNNSFDSHFTNRIPNHEPWARVDTLNDTTVDPELEYTSTNVGKQRRVTSADGSGDDTTPEITEITRGTNWRR